MHNRRLEKILVVISAFGFVVSSAGCGPKDCPPGTAQMGNPWPRGKSLQCMRRIQVDGMGKEVNHGPFKKWFDDGSPAVDANYVDGKKQGHYMEWWERGGKTKIEADYVNDVPDGLYREWHDNGAKRLEANYKDGKLNGTYTTFFIDGNKLKEINYKNGVEDGPKTEVWANGSKKLEAMMKDGKYHGIVKKWFENGSIESDIEYANGVPHGKYCLYIANGQISHQITYVNGKKEGPATEWYPYGKISAKHLFKNNESVEYKQFDPPPADWEPAPDFLQKQTPCR